MNNVPSQAAVKRYAAYLDDLVPFVFGYARRKRMIEKIEREYGEFDDVWKEYPDNWEDACMSMLIMHEVLGSGEKTAALVRSLKKELSNEILSMLRYWRSNPWFFAAFKVVRDLGNDFLEIEFVGDPPETCRGGFPDTRILYSSGTADNFRDGKTLFLTLLYHNREVLFTYGIIIPFSGIDENDLFYFADIAWHRDISLLEVPVFGINERSTDLTDTIADDPLSFLRLFKFSQYPAAQNRDGAIEKCVSVLDFDSRSLPEDEHELEALFSASGEAVDRIVVNEYGIGIFFGRGIAMYDPVLYFSFNDSLALLFAMTMGAYERGRKAASGICGFPGYPEVHASVNMMIAAHEILEYEDMLFIMETLVGDSTEEENKEEPGLSGDELDKINAVGRKLIDNYNKGTGEDDGTIASSLGVSEEMVSSLRKGILESDIFKDMGPGTDRFGLPPEAFSLLTGGGVPRADGYLVLFSPDEIEAAIKDRGLAEKDVFSAVPVMRFALWILSRAVQDAGIPATKAGYVGTQVIKEALTEKLLPTIVDYLSGLNPGKPMDEKFAARFSPKKESDWKDFLMFRKLLEKGGLLHFRGSRFMPSQKAEELLSSPVDLYHYLVKEMFTSFAWDHSERLGTIPYIHPMAGFLFYVLDKLSDENGGSWFSIRELSLKFVDAVPQIREKYEKEMRDGVTGFNTSDYFWHGINDRFISRFAVPFGLAESRSDSSYEIEIKRTDFFTVVFKK